MYLLPQAGIVANKLLTERFLNHIYRPFDLTPGIWNHDMVPVIFFVAVNDFGVQCVRKEHVTRLFDVLQQY